MKRLIALLAIIIAGKSTNASVWASENTWSQDWEDQYSQWVENEWDDEIFMRIDSPLYGVATDCADAAYTMRMFFSYENKLPFKIRNTQKTGGKFITNDTNEFDHVRNSHDRFLAFLKFVQDVTDSGTLANDTYPIAINRDSLRPGTLYVSPNDHSMMIKSISETGVATIYSSTVPKEVRYLQISNSYPYYIPEDRARHRDGYRAFKQPQHYEIQESTLPNFSLEQYTLASTYGDNTVTFIEAMIKKMQLRPETLQEKSDRSFRNLCYSIQLRANYVRDALDLQSSKGNRCFNASDYEDNSTPNRDKRIKDSFDYLENLFHSREYIPSKTQFAPFFNALFTDDQKYAKELKDWCVIRTYDESIPRVSMRDAWLASKESRLVSDPNASGAQRWGLEPYSPVCPQY